MNGKACRGRIEAGVWLTNNPNIKVANIVINIRHDNGVDLGMARCLYSQLWAL